MRGVLRITPFRQLWIALSLSSLGDWLGLLALTALARRLTDGGYAAANLAIAGVFILRLCPGRPARAARRASSPTGSTGG